MICQYTFDRFFKKSCGKVKPGYNAVMDRGEFARRLREQREGLGLRQADYASACGVSNGAVSAWERGDTYPSFDNIAAIARRYGVDVSYLCGIDRESSGLSGDEERLLKLYRGADIQGRRDIIDTAMDCYIEATKRVT